VHRSRSRRRQGRRPIAARASRSAAHAVLSDTVPTREGFFPPVVLLADPASRCPRGHIPTTLSYIFLRNRPCSTAPFPHVDACGSFSTSIGCSKAIDFTTIKVKLVHAVESRSWSKQGRKRESCSMNPGLDSKRK
jgi:hypothetical protein